MLVDGRFEKNLIGKDIKAERAGISKVIALNYYLWR